MAGTNKAGDLASRLRGAASAPVAIDSPAPAPLRAAPRAAGGTTSKYTVLFEAGDNETLETFLWTAKSRTNNYRLGKSDIIRALIQRLAADDALKAQVLDDLS